MNFFLKSQALWVLNNIPTSNTVGFLSHLHVGKIPFVVAINVIDKTSFSFLWEKKLSSYLFMLLDPKSLMNDIGLVNLCEAELWLHINLKFFPSSSFKHINELSIKSTWYIEIYFIGNFL